MSTNRLTAVKTPRQLKRGDVYWTSFNASVGSEIKKRRPAVIVSNDYANRFMDRVQVVPFTSNIQNVFPSEIVVMVKGQKSKAMADQITTASIERLGDKLGHLTDDAMREIERVIKVQLGLSDQA
jgi:mRNA interferase MazF